jgi:hypothetical protein
MLAAGRAPAPRTSWAKANLLDWSLATLAPSGHVRSSCANHGRGRCRTDRWLRSTLWLNRRRATLCDGRCPAELTPRYVGAVQAEVASGGSTPAATGPTSRDLPLRRARGWFGSRGAARRPPMPAAETPWGTRRRPSSRHGRSLRKPLAACTRRPRPPRTGPMPCGPRRRETHIGEASSATIAVSCGQTVQL